MKPVYFNCQLGIGISLNADNPTLSGFEPLYAAKNEGNNTA